MTVTVTMDEGNLVLPGPDLGRMSLQGTFGSHLSADLVTVDTLEGEEVTVDQLKGVPQLGQMSQDEMLVLGVRVLGTLLAVHHGRKRHRGETIPVVAWGVAGWVFPVITNLVAAFQGYAEPAPAR